MTTSGVRSKLVKNLTPQEYADCCSLSWRHRGSMMPTLMDIRNGNDYAKRFEDGVAGRVFFVCDDDKLLGWSLLFTDWYGNPMVFYYVRKANRRQGIGTRLARAVQRHHSTAHGVPHDSVSTSFFEHIETHIKAS